MSARSRVVVAMSGGVDSSVAAGLLVEQGYEVIGLTIKTYRYEDVGGNAANESSCCSLDGINDARRVAGSLGIPHYVLDFSGRFSEEVIDPFVAEYLSGRTPNPCVLCNRSIKWEELLRKSVALGASAIATGHYAAVRRDPPGGRWVLSRGRDRSKDQSYALWGLTQDSLAKTIFPLSDLTKEEARAAASRMGLPVASKGESFEICFVPDNNYGRFLRDRVPGLERDVGGGEFVMNGKIVGTHRGYPFYTIGQRKGLGTSFGAPVYVTAIDSRNNRIELGPEDRLYSTSLVAGRVNFVKYPALSTPLPVRAMVRYKDEGGDAVAVVREDGRLVVRFDRPRRAITPGQSVVLYEGDDLVCGGIIEEAPEEAPE